MLCLYWTTAIVESVTMSDMTTISSMIVKPAAERNLPVTIFGPIQRGAIKCRADVEDVLSAPMCRIRIILIRAQGPLGPFGHRVDRNTAEEFQLSPGCVVRHGNALNQRLEIGRVTFAACLDLE